MRLTSPLEGEGAGGGGWLASSRCQTTSPLHLCRRLRSRCLRRRRPRLRSRGRARGGRSSSSSAPPSARGCPSPRAESGAPRRGSTALPHPSPPTHQPAHPPLLRHQRSVRRSGKQRSRKESSSSSMKAHFPLAAAGREACLCPRNTCRKEVQTAAAGGLPPRKSPRTASLLLFSAVARARPASHVHRSCRRRRRRHPPPPPPPQPPPTRGLLRVRRAKQSPPPVPAPLTTRGGRPRRLQRILPRPPPPPPRLLRPLAPLRPRRSPSWHPQAWPCANPSPRRTRSPALLRRRSPPPPPPHPLPDRLPPPHPIRRRSTRLPRRRHRAACLPRPSLPSQQQPRWQRRPPCRRHRRRAAAAATPRSKQARSSTLCRLPCRRRGPARLGCPR